MQSKGNAKLRPKPSSERPLRNDTPDDFEPLPGHPDRPPTKSPGADPPDTSHAAEAAGPPTPAANARARRRAANARCARQPCELAPPGLGPRRGPWQPHPAHTCRMRAAPHVRRAPPARLAGATCAHDCPIRLRARARALHAAALVPPAQRATHARAHSMRGRRLYATPRRRPPVATLWINCARPWSTATHTRLCRRRATGCRQYPRLTFGTHENCQGFGGGPHTIRQTSDDD